GFKNNSSYDRFWEGRKIWGGVVNSSRTWAAQVLAYVDPGVEDERALETRRRMVYRHVAYINALRMQLRRKSRFFDRPARATKKRLAAHAEVMRNDWDAELAPFLSPEELAQVSTYANPATHMLKTQALEAAQLLRDGRLDLFHQMELMHIVEEFYTLQGKCERIKNTPFPRQYAELSRMFTRIFVFLVPLGMIDVFSTSIEHASGWESSAMMIAAMVLSSALVTWVFVTMEGIGDASEDPFERSMNDVPMNALCLTIEIDLSQMLGETEVPDKEPVVDGWLMY
ncbi:MAG: bestrophin family ion channel, partial [Myxococcota bacterium]